LQLRRINKPNLVKSLLLFRSRRRRRASASPWLLFTAAIEIYHVISFRFRMIRRNRRNLIYRNSLSAKGSHMQLKWGGGVATERRQGSNRMPSPPAPQYLLQALPCDRRQAQLLNAPLSTSDWLYMAALGPSCSSLVLSLSPSLLTSPTVDSTGQKKQKGEIWRNCTGNRVSPNAQ